MVVIWPSPCKPTSNHDDLMAFSETILATVPVLDALAQMGVHS